MASPCRSSTSTSRPRVGLPVQPDELRPDGDHRHDDLRRRRHPTDVEVPFQVTNCAVLKFNPKFTVSTSGKTSRAKGASLTLKVTRPSGPGTGQANFALAKIELPKQLPSRLDDAAESVYRGAVRREPRGVPGGVGHRPRQGAHPDPARPAGRPRVLRQPRRRSVPERDLRAAGLRRHDRRRLDTFISKAGITSATLKTVPDAPFTSFELTFPEKQYSALAANGNLCNGQGRAEDANRIHRPERPEDQPEHEDHRHRLRKDRKAQDQAKKGKQGKRKKH